MSVTLLERPFRNLIYACPPSSSPRTHNPFSSHLLLQLFYFWMLLFLIVDLAASCLLLLYLYSEKWLHVRIACDLIYGHGCESYKLFTPFNTKWTVVRSLFWLLCLYFYDLGKKQKVRRHFKLVPCSDTSCSDSQHLQSSQFVWGSLKAAGCCESVLRERDS